MRAGNVERCLSVARSGFPIRTMNQQELDHLDLSVIGCAVQRREVAFLYGVDIRAVFDQKLSEFEMLPCDGGMKRLDFLSVLRGGIDLRTCFDQKTSDSGMPEKGG